MSRSRPLPLPPRGHAAPLATRLLSAIANSAGGCKTLNPVQEERRSATDNADRAPSRQCQRGIDLGSWTVSGLVRLFVVVLETGASRPVYHAVADEGVAFRRIAEAIDRGLGLLTESRSADHFSWFARMASGDMAGTVDATRAATGWVPRGTGLLSDLAEPSYYVG